AKGGAGETAQNGRGTEKDNRRINLNRAGEEELTRLPGIGPALARRIVEYRQQAPFRRVEDLQQVSGIGPSKFQRLKPLVEV
ncbi:ComEA family DNA-binding protein, partial [Acidaminococcus fermentans]